MTQVLDCTLRDGGYYTAWDFDPAWVETYLRSVSRLPIDYVEVGYVNDPQPGYSGEYFYLTAPRLREIRAALAPHQKLVVMIDGKNQSVERMQPLFSELRGLVDVVRITAAPAALGHSLGLARALTGLGFEVGLNVMYLSTFQDDLSRIREVIDQSDAFRSVALVDSYGGCSPSAVGRSIRELKAALPDNVVGYHGHDNMCLAFANTLAAIEAGVDVVDGTLAGMGRGAGNLRTETALIHLSRGAGAPELDYAALTSAVEPVEALRSRYGWGTNLPYMISGANNLPQKDVMDWLAKNRYSVVSIIEALRTQSGGASDLAPYASLAETGVESEGGAVLVIGGGPSVLRHRSALSQFVSAVNPTVLFSSARHLELVDHFGGARQLLCLAGHEAGRVDALGSFSGLSGLVVPAPPRVAGCLPAASSLPVFQAEPLHVSEEAKLGPVSDFGPLALTLGAAIALEASTCFLAGFDGYPLATSAEQELALEVQGTLNRFRELRPTAQVMSITPTTYDVEQRSVYGLLAAAS